MQQWLLNMKHFKHEAEMRRVLFGLGAVGRGEGLPEGVLESISEVGLQIVEVALKQVEGREETLADNLKHLEDGGDDDSSENGEMSEGSGENEEEEFKNIKSKLQQFKNGKAETDSESDEDDSDYDPDFDGEMDLYDSRLDEVDELLYLKTTFEILHQHKPDYYATLVSKCTPEKLQ
jgi:hypothetical protein